MQRVAPHPWAEGARRPAGPGRTSQPTGRRAGAVAPDCACEARQSPRAPVSQPRRVADQKSAPDAAGAAPWFVQSWSA